MDYKAAIDLNLEHILMRYPESELKEAIRYSLTSGGKRIRPTIGCILLECAGIDPTLYLDYFCAVEMIHTYSLIHDDLPAMDDDDIRRGKPSLHKQYSEAVAILAGDALLTEAFNIIAQGSSLNSDQKLQCIQLLSANAGLDGMVQGQMMDMSEDKTSVEPLLETHGYKTSTLFVAITSIARIITKSNQINEYQHFGYYFGVLFQILDDIKDSDGVVEILKEDKSNDLATEYKKKIFNALDSIEINTDKMKDFIKSI